MIIPLHIRYADVPCRYCGATETKPCRTLDGFYNYDFRYTHAIRRRMWWALQHRREQETH